eukprot:sb/3472121/
MSGIVIFTMSSRQTRDRPSSSDRGERKTDKKRQTKSSKDSGSRYKTDKKGQSKTYKKGQYKTDKRSTSSSKPWWTTYQGPSRPSPPIFRMEGEISSSDRSETDDNNETDGQTNERTDPLSEFTNSITGPRTAPVTALAYRRDRHDSSASDRPHSLPTNYNYDPEFFSHFIQ